MTLRIPAGKHRARPFSFGLWWRRTHFSWVVKFDESCRYNLGNEDQLDVNKLVGIGYLWHHHKDSARFGWRYDIETDRIILSAYCYVDGRRVVQHICFCEIGKEYQIDLTILSTMYFFACYKVGDRQLTTNGSAEVPYDHNKKLQYRLGTYFGGQAVAQHDTYINLKKLG